MKLSFLKLSPGYFGLWVVLLLILVSKLYLIRPSSEVDLVALGVFGIAMLAASYLGAWAVWALTGRKQRTGEFTYLAIMTVLFLVRTILIYSEALAGRA